MRILGPSEAWDVLTHNLQVTVLLLFALWVLTFALFWQSKSTVENMCPDYCIGFLNDSVVGVGFLSNGLTCSCYYQHAAWNPGVAFQLNWTHLINGTEKNAT